MQEDVIKEQLKMKENLLFFEKIWEDKIKKFE